MSSLRRYCVQILTLLVLCTSVLLVFFQKKTIKNISPIKNEQVKNEQKQEEQGQIQQSPIDDPENNLTSQIESKKTFEQKTFELTQPYEERVFSLQTKFTFGLLHFVKDKGPSSVQISQFANTLKDSIEESLIFSHKQKKELKQVRVESYYTKELIVADALKLEEAKTLLCEDSVYTDGFKNEKLLDKIARSICSQSEGEETKIPSFFEDEIKEANEKLDWFFDVYTSSPDEVLNVKLGSSETKGSFSDTFVKLGIGIFIAFIVGGLSFILSLYFGSLLLFKKARLQFEQPTILSDYCLETFFLYMLSMSLLPLLLFIPFLQSNALPANVVLISSLTLLILWPTFFGQSRKETLRSIGAYLGGANRFFKDIAFGITAYITAIFPMLTVLAIYSLFLTAISVDVNSGTHPIVPILTETKNSSTLFYIVILATVVAPVVEEFMFRGALYSWMRARMNAPLSIIINSFIFAAIHPQGAVGIVPLTCIGIVLATLREWRGNLTSCMIAHACFNGGTLLLAFNFLR